MKFGFQAANEETKAILDMNEIPWTEDENGINVEFPESVRISDDRDENSQPSYYQYDVFTSHGVERFVYPLDTQTLVVE